MTIDWTDARKQVADVFFHDSVNVYAVTGRQNNDWNEMTSPVLTLVAENVPCNIESLAQNVTPSVQGYPTSRQLRISMAKSALSVVDGQKLQVQILSSRLAIVSKDVHGDDVHFPVIQVQEGQISTVLTCSMEPAV